MKKYGLIFVLCLSIAGMTHGTELLVNGDFEVGSTTGYWMPTEFDSPSWERFTWGGNIANCWLTDGGGNNDTGAIGEVTVDDKAVKWRWSGTGIFQTVAAEGGSEYTFSIDVYNSADTNPASAMDLSIKVNFRDQEDAWIGDVVTVAIYDSEVELGGSWVTISGILVAPAGTTSLQYRVMSDNGGGGYLYADNASVQVISPSNPYPADGGTVNPDAISELICDVEVPDSNDVAYEVWWGVDLVDPNISDLILDGFSVAGISAGPVATVTASVTLAKDHIYHWAVVATHNNKEYVGQVWSFSTVNGAPEAEITSPVTQNAWLLGGSVVVSVEGIASDDGLPVPPATLTTQWICDPATGVIFSDGTSLVTDVTFTEPGTYSLTLIANDSVVQTASAPIVVNVYGEGVDGLVALYEFEGNAYDSIGGHDGTLVGSVNLPVIDTVDAKVGSGSLSLTENDQMVQILDSGVETPEWDALPGEPNEVLATWADFTETNQMSASVWVSVDSWTGSYQNILYKSQGYAIVRQAETSNTMFRVGSWGDGNPGPEIAVRDNDDVTVAVDDGNWHHVVGTYDGLKLCIYVDGVLENIEFRTDYLNAMPLGGTYLEIGRHGVMRIDQVRLHDIALSAEMVMAQFVADGGVSSCRQQYVELDLNQDCYVDMGDLAIIASGWLSCTDLSNPDSCN